MEWWNVGIMEYWEKTRITSGTVQNPLLEYSNLDGLVKRHFLSPVCHSCQSRNPVILMSSGLRLSLE
jgi:hypothetical protein